MSGRRAQGKHAGLSRERVVEAAVRLVDGDGVATLSMRRLARELEVEAMTLYHHVPNKQALEDGIVEYVLAEALRGATGPATSHPASSAPASWQQSMAGYADGLHRALSAHPGTAILFASRPAVTTRNLAELEGLLRVLREAGFAARTALLMVYALAGSVVMQHLGDGAEDSRSVQEELGRGFPVFSEAVAAGPPSTEARLRFTVDSLIAGFETLGG